jgi:uncharacterized protein (TIGR02391 family)
MTYLHQLVPDALTIKTMHPADLAGYVLEALASFGDGERGMLHRRNFCGNVMDQFRRGRDPHDGAIGVACAVAWSWLEVHGLICPSPHQENEWFIITPRGRDVRDRAGVRKLVEAQQLPEHFLHAALIRDVLPFFLQGRFDTAVFEAFRRLEIAIRDAAALGDEWIGTRLAARAFNPDDGPLTDKAAEAGERQALMNLMTGALGSYKNPQSHRHVGLGAPEAREMLMLASHLLGIVDSRRKP